MNKNTCFYGECIDYTYDGLGIVKVDGRPYFVKGMLLHEKGELKVIKELKHYGVARLMSLDERSSFRQEPRCPIYKLCGSCHLQHMNLEGQQAFKTHYVKQCMERIGHLQIDVEDTLMDQDPWYYRNKIQTPVGYQHGELVIGYYKQHSNDIIAMDHCFIQQKEANIVLQRIRSLLDQYQIEPYDKVQKKGSLKHILIKYGYHTQELMVAFITYTSTLKHQKEIVKALVKEFPMIKTILLNVNPRHDNVILGDEEKILYGPGYIEDLLLGNRYRISLASFYQVNPRQVEVLYQKAIELAHFQQDDIVIDAYCGVGTIGLSLAKYVKHVYGVEVVERAIEDAKINAKMNCIENVTFKAQDAGEFMMDYARSGKMVDVVMVDPPRKGCSQAFLEALKTLAPKKIVYISCDVATQARDLAYLTQEGYQVDECQPVDMFPQTYHVETVVLMSRKEK